MPYEEEISRIMDSLEEYATSKLYRYHCIEVQLTLARKQVCISRTLLVLEGASSTH